MFTLWSSVIGGSPYQKPEFVKSLSTDKSKALKLAEDFANRRGVPFYDESMDELNPIVRVHQWTPTMVRFGKNHGRELSDCEPKFVLWVAKGCPLQNDKGYWNEHHFGGLDFQTAAQTVAIEMGIGCMETRFKGREFFVTIEQFEKNTAKIAEQTAKLNAQQTGHHFGDNQRLTMTVIVIRKTGFESTFGWQNVIVFKDSENRLFTYKGTNSIAEVDETLTMTATIKWGEYRGEKTTYIQRIKISQTIES